MKLAPVPSRKMIILAAVCSRNCPFVVVLRRNGKGGRSFLFVGSFSIDDVLGGFSNHDDGGNKNVSVTEIALKSLFLCVNRSPAHIRCGFHAGTNAIRYSVNIVYGDVSMEGERS